jgi:hypothetical protein
MGHCEECNRNDSEEPTGAGSSLARRDIARNATATTVKNRKARTFISSSPLALKHRRGGKTVGIVPAERER